MSPKRQRFVQEYLVDLNATQAAIRAGYSKKTAGQIGEEILKIPEVAAAVAEGQAKIATKLEITQERIAAELAKIGFSDIRKAIRWFSQANVAAVDADADGQALVEEGAIRFAVANQVELVSSDEIDDATAAAISEIAMTSQGALKVKFHDKRAALVDLGKHLGMFKETIKLEVGDLAAELEAARRRAEGGSRC
jgi:phage terminase small subunit